MNEVEGLVTPTWITFVDATGREWKALALIAPLNSEDMDPVQLGVSEHLKLKYHGLKVIRG